MLVGCRLEDYSASRIAHAVEDCNAHVLNLNVTAMGRAFSDEDEEPPFPVVFELRVSHRNAEGVSRSLERYGYTVLGTRSDSTMAHEDSTRSRIDHLLHYLDI